MNKKEKVQFILDFLENEYPETPIPLAHHDAYTLLIAVLLSAQCTDERVNQVTPKLFGMADTPEKMITHSIEEIEKIVKPCGLSGTKSKAIWNLSNILIHTYGGTVPKDFEALESLPGVGHKTASVVMAQAFGVPTFPVDTHIHRLLYRWRMSNGKSVQQTEKDAKRLFPKDTWNQLHLRIIFYGRQYCKARGHIKSNCPICHAIDGRES
jgi:endonuclease-3